MTDYRLSILFRLQMLVNLDNVQVTASEKVIWKNRILPTYLFLPTLVRLCTRFMPSTCLILHVTSLPHAITWSTWSDRLCNLPKSLTGLLRFDTIKKYHRALIVNIVFSYIRFSPMATIFYNL